MARGAITEHYTREKENPGAPHLCMTGRPGVLTSARDGVIVLLDMAFVWFPHEWLLRDHKGAHCFEGLVQSCTHLGFIHFKPAL